MRARRMSNRRCCGRPNSSATCCGRCWTRSTTPMSRPSTCHRAPSCQPIRDPEMSDQSIPAEARPRLPRGVRLAHNEAQGGWVLLAPERVFKADAIAVEIIKRCTGEASFGEIIDDLAKAFSSAPREKILSDVTTLLRGLADKRLLEL